MSRSWNWKAIIDALGKELWDVSSEYRADIIRYCNEIQDEIASELPQGYFKFKLKKLLPVSQEIIDLAPQIPSAPTTALATGGSLTDTTAYKVYVTFVVFDDDIKKFMESELSPAGTERTATGADLQIDVSAIDLYDGTITLSPNVIYRNIYVAKKAATDDDYGEPLFSSQITDNTTLVVSITAEPSSTVTPPSDSEVDQLTSDHLYFNNANKFLNQMPANKLRRIDPDSNESTAPDRFDYVGTTQIMLSPKLAAASSDDQRTLSYFVYRRPHEAFYDVDKKVDLPILFKRALVQGIRERGYWFDDRDGKVTEANRYEALLKKAVLKLRRPKGKPRVPRDTAGNTGGFERW